MIITTTLYIGNHEKCLKNIVKTIIWGNLDVKTFSLRSREDLEFLRDYYFDLNTLTFLLFHIRELETIEYTYDC